MPNFDPYDAIGDVELTVIRNALLKYDPANTVERAVRDACLKSVMTSLESRKG